MGRQGVESSTGFKEKIKKKHKNTVQEFSEIYNVETDFFIPLQKCRENLLRLNEIKQYIEENGFLEKVLWKNHFLKIDGLNTRFQSLEREMGFKNQPSGVINQQEIYGQYVTEHEIEDIYRAIHKYLSLNADIEERTTKIFDRINEQYLEEIFFYQNKLKMMASPTASVTSEIVKFSAFFTSFKSKNIERISIESDKYVTYQLKSKENISKTDVIHEFKIQDRTYNIKMLYEQMLHYEESLYKLIECITDVEQKEKVSKLNKRLLVLTWVSVAFVITQTFIGVISTYISFKGLK
ncbi:hypothetical protein CN503_09495 [Bacillus cereus]|uniref:hypothetical protein n=1 Tax=Bacillus cereus TaxID=1396 RepID=UPI000BF70D02|nr:hypothetical protein [Bacillus cereus]PER68562.1 hypothetical protein CN503_09495 [Bacillus cereus]